MQLTDHVDWERKNGYVDESVGQFGREYEPCEGIAVGCSSKTGVVNGANGATLKDDDPASSKHPHDADCRNRMGDKAEIPG